ncbi:cell surface protein [Methanosarcina sp. Kolksee]|uniref:PKD domain-containing protein n=1 Tax=Methanosarcina sp. Kolksee TaxID=1434099 RepID=UPI000615DE06|nr:PKD domain-containing protein [Methanosarcina sp. Kolksee]AKB47715.1 cell surface protein [Methanosarcina sp. Kolksee]
MKINKKLYSVTSVLTVLILFLILIPSTASAASSSAITETRITNHGTAANPDIYGNNIVWQDNRNGNWDIYIFDLSTKKEIHTTNTTDQITPSIYGNLVVWEDGRNGGHDIYMEDLSTKKQTRIPTSGAASTPDIYGNKIVYVKQAFNERESWYDLYMYDLSTKKETQIPTLRSANGPSIYGDKIVWLDFDTFNGGDYYICMYDLSTKTRTQIAKAYWGKGQIGVPEIYDGKIVYSADFNWSDNMYDDIYMYDLSTKKETQITNISGVQACPVIYGNKIVWEDDSGDDGNTNHGIYMYDISTKQEMKISAKESAYYPAIYGNNIVWQYSDRYVTGDIYMATLGSDLPVAAFSASPTSGNLPLKVQFSDKSTGSPTSWKWNFGDGKTSTSRNPAHTYAKAGKYTVSLTVKNAAGTNTKTIKNYITVKTAPVKPVAAFSASPTSGYAPLKVKFTDKSANSPTSWKWNFGDGKTSTSKSPTYTYSKAGKYTVSLTVKNAAGSSTKTIKNYIVVNALKAPVAAFSAKPTSGKAPLNVQFTDKSANSPTSWKWSFGDGKTSTSKNPAHKYSKAGKYTVSLTVKNAKGSSTKTISGYIKVQ